MDGLRRPLWIQGPPPRIRPFVAAYSLSGCHNRISNTRLAQDSGGTFWVCTIRTASHYTTSGSKTSAKENFVLVSQGSVKSSNTSPSEPSPRRLARS